MAISDLAIVHRLRVHFGIFDMSGRYFVCDVIAVLHEGGAQNRQHPEWLSVAGAPFLQGRAIETALGEDRSWVELVIFELVNALGEALVVWEPRECWVRLEWLVEP